MGLFNRAQGKDWLFINFYVFLISIHNGPYIAPFTLYLLTPWCRVLLEKLTGLQLVKKFPAFHGTRRFITALTSVRHLSLSWVSPIQSIYPHPTSWRSILILSTHLRLGLPSGLFPSGFPIKTLHAPCPHPYAPHNKFYYKTRICALNWLIPKIIFRYTVSKISKFVISLFLTQAAVLAAPYVNEE